MSRRSSTGQYWGVSGGVLLQSQVPDSTAIYNRRHITFESPIPSSQTKHLVSGELHPLDHPLTCLMPPRPNLSRHQSCDRLKNELDNSLAPRRPLRLSQLVTDKPAQQPTNQVAQFYGAKCMGSGQARVDLSATRRHEIMACMNKSVEEVVASMLPDEVTNSPWKLKLSKKEMAYFVDETKGRADQTRFCCTSYTHATVAEMMDLFLPREDKLVLRNHKLLFDNVVNSKVLLTLRSPTKEEPMNTMYVRYSSFKTSGLVSNREMYVVVATNMIRQADGSTIGYCLWDSIDDYEIMKTIRTPGFELSTCFRSGFYFHHPGRMDSMSENATQGQTRIVYMVGMEGGPWGFSRLLMEKHGSVVDRLCTYFRRKYLDPSSFVTKTQWKSKSEVKNCKQCDKQFKLLSNRVNCHACGHLVCKSCVSKETVKLHSVGLITIHVCFSCLQKAGLPASAAVQKKQSRLRQRRLTVSTFRRPVADIYTDRSFAHDTDTTSEWI